MDSDGFVFGINGCYLVQHFYLHMKTLRKTLRRLQGEGAFFLDNPADIIRQAAIGIRNIDAALINSYIGLFVQPAIPGGGRRAASHAADDTNF